MSEELKAKVIAGLKCCAEEPEAHEDCGDCPYRDPDVDFCISRLCRDALKVIAGGEGP